MKVLISGASGFVGSAVTAALAAAGHQVVRLVRQPTSGSEREWSWDPLRGEIDPRVGEGLDAVVHLAGENIAARRWTAGFKARIRESRVKGSELLVRSLARLGRPPTVFVAASATGYYGDRGDQLLDEHSGPGHGFLPEVSVAWEQAAAPLVGLGTRVVWLRIGMVLGPGGGALEKVVPIFRWGLGGVLGSGGQYWSWIHRKDLVGIVVSALEDSAFSGAVNAVAPSPVTNREFTRTLAGVVNRPAFMATPAFALRLLVGEMADALLLSSARVLPKQLESVGYGFGFKRLHDALVDVLGGGPVR